MRQRRTSSSTNPAPTAYASPGDLVRETGRRFGWELGCYNLMVEGTTDEAYCQLANSRYRDSCGKNLIGTDFNVFAVGKRNEGGTDAINEKLNVLSTMLKIDPVDEQDNRIRVVALFDDDYAGRKTFAAMKRKFQPWRDIFLLRRKFPRNTRDPKTFERVTETINEEYRKDKTVHCEIEDLLDRAVIDLFVEMTPNCLQREITKVGDGFHCDFQGWAKGKLASFVKSEAGLNELAQIVEMLKTFRYLLGLPPDGVEIH